MQLCIKQRQEELKSRFQGKILSCQLLPATSLWGLGKADWTQSYLEPWQCPKGLWGYGSNLIGGVAEAAEGQQGSVQTGCGPGVAQLQQGVCISVFSSLEMDGVNN